MNKEEKEDSITLLEKSISNVPLQVYNKDFKFIVNGKDFLTTKIIADLISRKISNMHYNDPTVSEYHINTNEKGDFAYILNAINFRQNNIPDSQIPFISELIKILESDSIVIHSQDEGVEITTENVIHLLQKHEKFPNYRMSHEIA